MYWVTLDRFKNHRKRGQITAPYSLMEKLPETVIIRYGQLNVTAVIKSYEGNEKNPGTDFNTPEVIQCSRDIFDALSLVAGIPMQLQYHQGIFEIGPVIGILLGNQRYYYHDNYMDEFTDALSGYEETGGLFIAFREEGIDWEEGCVRGLYYHYYLKKWLYGKAPIPNAVFRRSFKGGEITIDKLVKATSGRVFNSHRYDKYAIYELIHASAAFRKYVPETKRVLNIEDVCEFVQKHSRIILKPAGLSRGRGICILHKNAADAFILYDYRGAAEKAFNIRNEGELKKFLSEQDFFQKDYIMQPHLCLARINGSPFDIRVVMQKDAGGEWKCNGIECRLAGTRDMVTNIARGGQALPISHTIRLAFGHTVHPAIVKNEVIQIARKFCIIMDSTGGHFAEFGIDIAVDIDKRYWFIEGNVRATFKGFRELNYQTYLRLCRMPIMYAVCLTGFKKGGRG